MSESYALEVCQGKQFVFDFSFENVPDQNCDSSNSHPISYKLYRSDKPQENFTWQGCLAEGKVNSYQLSFPDDINIKGTLQFRRGLDKLYLWMDVFYCLELSKHFEGNALVVPTTL